MQYKVKKRTQSWCGEAIGIMVLDAAYACVPGNVSNATTFDYPVRYEEIKGASIDRLILHRDPLLKDAFIAAARGLEARGVKAITGACGFMALFQSEVAAAVDVPVFMSSLAQIPFIYGITNKRVGILTANASALTQLHFDAMKIPRSIPLAIGDMSAKREFRSAILEEKGTLDTDIIEREAVEVATDLARQNPDIGAFLLECSDLPPYASAIHQHTGLPVFDFVTMINYVCASLIPRRYEGFM
jgi:aspartate/glutamate racemase